MKHFFEYVKNGNIKIGYTKTKEVFKMSMIQKIALIFTIIGAINWGLIGIFDFNLVSTLFGIDTFLTHLIYIIVGICGLINAMLLFDETN